MGFSLIEDRLRVHVSRRRTKDTFDAEKARIILVLLIVLIKTVIFKEYGMSNLSVESTL